MTAYPRDLVGYGPDPPDPRWPGGARLALQIVMNYEEGGEQSILHGDAHAEAFLGEVVGTEPLAGVRNVQMESVYEYGSRVGLWRLLRLFAERGVPISVFAVAMALERHPVAARAIVAVGLVDQPLRLRAMVPNTSDDLSDPETPVNTVSRRLGILTLRSFRLFTRAPWTRMRSWLSAVCRLEEAMLRDHVIEDRRFGKGPPASSSDSFHRPLDGSKAAAGTVSSTATPSAHRRSATSFQRPSALSSRSCPLT